MFGGRTFKQGRYRVVVTICVWPQVVSKIVNLNQTIYTMKSKNKYNVKNVLSLSSPIDLVFDV